MLYKNAKKDGLIIHSFILSMPEIVNCLSAQRIRLNDTDIAKPPTRQTSGGSAEYCKVNRLMRAKWDPYLFSSPAIGATFPQSPPLCVSLTEQVLHTALSVNFN